jgi:hypothetical protein
MSIIHTVESTDDGYIKLNGSIQFRINNENNNSSSNSVGIEMFFDNSLVTESEASKIVQDFIDSLQNDDIRVNYDI